MTTTKSLQHLEVKNAARGEVEAVFATLNVVDSDGDVTLPGAFPTGVTVPISAYGHASWQGALPVGKGTIRETRTEAVFTGRFFLDTVAGADTFTVVKELGDLGQWSYGYAVEDSEPGKFDGRRVRFLKKLKVHEVSPVLIGAGVGTRTLAAKRADGTDTRAEAEREFLRFVAASAGVDIEPHDDRQFLDWVWRRHLGRTAA